MSKYNVGDVVTVRSDLIVGHRYGGYDGSGYDGFVADMRCMLGCLATIDRVIFDGEGKYKYLIKECGYNWTDEMFEDTSPERHAELIFDEDEFNAFLCGFMRSEKEVAIDGR